MSLTETNMELVQERIRNQKKLKALEIIKEKLKDFIDYDKNTKAIYINGAIDCDKLEYDLFREVLL